MVETQSKSGPSSSRHLTKLTGTFTRSTAGSQSLERGLRILRAFRAGGDALTNAELALRTGLPRPTVSRLLRSLVDAEFLSYDLASGAYRLAAVVLSLAVTYQSSSSNLRVVMPLIRKLAEREKVNVGLAVADQLDMVYIAALRKGQDSITKTRNHVPGSRVPIEQTAVGLAYLAGMTEKARDRLLAQIAPKYGNEWSKVKSTIERSRDQLLQQGYCTAEWNPGLIGIGTNITAPNRDLYGVNISFYFDGRDTTVVVDRFAIMLLQLVADIKTVWDRVGP